MVEPLSRKRSSRLTGPLLSIWQQPRSVNFLYWQYIYYFVLYSLSSLIFLISGLRGGKNVGFLNSLFLCISAGTGAGLNTVDLSTLNTFQQVILWLLIILGSHTFVFAGLVITLRIKYKRRKTRESQRRISAVQASIMAQQTDEPGTDFLKEQSRRSSGWPYQLNTSDLSVIPLPRIDSTKVSKDVSSDRDSISEIIEKPDPGSVCTITAVSGLAQAGGYRERPRPRGSACYENTERELEMRYQAFSLLSWIVPLYIVLFQFGGAIILGWFISVRHPSAPAENHINSWWSGIFLAISAFNNSGMSLLDTNMAPFQQSYFVLLATSALILFGNTMFPILLRIIIRCLAKIVPKGDGWQGWRDGFRLLIDEKSRTLCPYLFTRSELFWLAGTVFILNGVDWAAFGVSAAENPAFKDFPVIARVVDGLFQAFAVRSGGFSVVGISSLRIGVQTIYILMMYISSFPISPDNVWESELSGVAGPLSHEELGRARDLVVCRHPKIQFLKRQVSRTFTVDDFWLLSAFVWVICVVETPHFEVDPASYSVFNIVFEVISAYGCVGVSIGHPNYTTSLSGALRGGSQLLLCAVMILGRTREARKGIMKGNWGIGAAFPGMEEEEDVMERLDYN